jgi:hypothetical protein
LQSQLALRIRALGVAELLHAAPRARFSQRRFRQKSLNRVGDSSVYLTALDFLVAEVGLGY